MGLIDRTTRVTFDGDGNDWVDVRPLSLGELRAFRQAAGAVEPGLGEEKLEAQGYEFSKLVLDACVVAWSDDAPVSPENIQKLPYEFTFKLTAAAGIRGEQESPLADGSSLSDS